MASQVSRAERLAGADDVIDNIGATEDLPPQVERLHRHYLSLKKESGQKKGKKGSESDGTNLSEGPSATL